MIHIIGDIIQSIGVIIAAILIYFFPNYQIIDPLMTIFFSVIVVFTTVPIIKQCILVIMEGTHPDYNIDEIRNIISEVKGVESVKCMHLVALSLEKPILEVKVVTNFKNENILTDIHKQLECFEFHHVNVEIQKPCISYLGDCHNKC